MELLKLSLIIVAMNLHGANSALYHSGDLCSYEYDSTPMPSNQSAVKEPELVNIVLNSTGENCMCTVAATTIQTDFDLGMIINPFEENECAAFIVQMQGHTFYSCPQYMGSARIRLQRKSFSIGVYNPDSVQMQTSLNIFASNMYFTMSCDSMESVTEASSCPCDSLDANVGVLFKQETNIVPTSRRLLVGFMCALAFLICVGIVLILLFLTKKGIVKVPKQVKKVWEKKVIEDPYKTIEHSISYGAKNMGYVDETPKSVYPLPQPKKNMFNTFASPSYRNNDGIYATIDLSSNNPHVISNKTAFSPDNNLQLDLRTPDDTGVGSKYRGHYDSGLYSKIKQPHQNTALGLDNSFTVGPYATSMDTLQGLGHSFEPPADQSSPKLQSKIPSEQQIDALYAKPDKSKKKKRKNKPTQSDKSSLSKENLPAQISIEQLPEYHPKPISSRSGSSNIVNSRTGSVGLVNMNSRSDNELYFTDVGSDYHGSRGTVSTDV